ncbi:ABC transporter permease [Humibacter ginsenosidimutans]|uniref:ABC transporter permease n=1 Tax=Humibacter ginsenosidimutans TaxID=2599293 RepID=A0A5B8M6Z5_9MICO|nr:ABC transporter permease [Humibacter ginsenosidimutans]QDZ16183.1 ABC transporter permease [Humibacter ginsenosidimutans]
MFGTYLRRELLGRRRQTIIIAIGMALAIALVIIVNSVAAGVKNAQAQVLQSVYGVGTDITITKPVSAPTAGGDQAQGPRFNFGANSGTKSSDGSRKVDSSRLSVGFGTNVMNETKLTAVKKTSGVAAASAVLSLQNTSFNGTLPDFSQRSQGGQGGFGQSGSGGTQSDTGGADGKGGSSFQVNSFSVMGITPGAKAVGPVASTALAKGRTLAASDAGKDVAVLDSSYAKSKSLSVGDTLSVGGKDFKVVGTVKPTGSDSATAANVYIPLDVAQSLSTEKGKISTIYVSAQSASDVDSLKSALQKSVPGTTVSTQADLASSVSGSLGSAGQLVSNLGTWLSVIVLAAAFLIAILFTISGVTRRTREFGTLKAIGWSNRRIVGQVAGESVVQGVIGGVVGIVVGLIGVLVVNVISPTLTGGVSSGGFGGALADGARRAFGGERTGGGGAVSTGAPGAGFGGAGGFGEAARSAASSASTQVDLSAPITVWIIVIAVALAVLGGLLAGAIGGWRASRLRPAEALRSVQ